MRLFLVAAVLLAFQLYLALELHARPVPAALVALSAIAAICFTP